MSPSLTYTVETDGAPTLPVWDTVNALPPVRLILRNPTDRTVTLTGVGAAPSADAHTLALRLSGGARADLPPAVAEAGWTASAWVPGDAWDTVYLASATDLEIAPGATRTLSLSGFAAAYEFAEPRALVHVSRGEVDLGRRPLDVVRVAGPAPPLTVGVAGDTPVVHDGETVNALTVEVSCAEPGRTVRFDGGRSRIGIAWDIGEPDRQWWALCRPAQAESAALHVAWTARTPVAASAPELSEDRATFAQVAPEDVEVTWGGDSVRIRVSNLTTSMPSGPANLYVTVSSLRGYRDTEFVVQVRKGAIIQTASDGTATVTVDGDLDVAHGVVVGAALQVDGATTLQQLTAGTTSVPDLTVSGKATLGTLTATGPAELSAGVTTPTLTATGLGSLGTLSVTGQAGLGELDVGSITATGRADLNAGVSTTSLMASGRGSFDSLGVTGHAGLGELDVGTITAAGRVYLNGGVSTTAITATGHADLTGGIRTTSLEVDTANPVVLHTEESKYSDTTNPHGSLVITTGIGGTFTINNYHEYWCSLKTSATAFLIESTVRIHKYGLIVDGAITEGSSRAIKERIRDLDHPATAILDVPVRLYRPLGGSADQEDVGLIAEEVHEAGLHHLVHYDEEGTPAGVHYTRVPMYLLALARQQQARLDARDAELTALREQVEALRALLVGATGGEAPPSD